jgi:hypothetical protein
LFEKGSPALHARDDDDTRPHRVQKKKRFDPTTESGLQIVTSSDADIAPDGMPAALSASGVFRPLPGVNRQVTGFFFPELEELKQAGGHASARVWYVAIGTRTRGPFAASEVVTLAEKGKVRDSTLVWRPGFGTWKRVKDGEAGSVEDLSWLRRVVHQRKVREREAQREAEARLGIRPVQLTRSSIGPRHVTTGTGPGMPPPLPPPAFDDALADDPSGVLQLSALLEDGPQPFAWRAEPSSFARAAGTQARNRSAWLVALCGAIVVGTVAGLLVAAAGAPWARLVASIAFE